MERHQQGPPDDKTLTEAYGRALIFAVRQLKRYSNSGMVAKIEPLDVVNEAVEKTMDETRPWNRDTTPDLYVHLAGCIRSIIQNTYTSSDMKLTDRGISSQDHISSHSCDCDPQTKLELESSEEFLLQYILEMRSDIRTLVEFMLSNGITEPREIAISLGMSVKQVNTQKTALKRLLQRSHFKLRYILKNRKDLIGVARAVYLDNASTDEELSRILNLPISSAKLLKQDLDQVIQDVYRGII